MRCTLIKSGFTYKILSYVYQQAKCSLRQERKGCDIEIALQSCINFCRLFISCIINHLCHLIIDRILLSEFKLGRVLGVLPCNFRGEITLMQHQQNSVAFYFHRLRDIAIKLHSWKTAKFFRKTDKWKKHLIISINKNATVLWSRFNKKFVYLIFLNFELYTSNIKTILK